MPLVYAPAILLWLKKEKACILNIIYVKTAAMGIENLKILVVDDEDALRQFTVLYLQRMNVPAENILEADNVLDALDLIDANTFDLIVTDNTMPGHTGIELIQMVRSNQNLHRQPVIVMASGDAGSETSEAARAAGVDAYLYKPFKMGQLTAAIYGGLAAAAQKGRGIDLGKGPGGAPEIGGP